MQRRILVDVVSQRNGKPEIVEHDGMQVARESPHVADGAGCEFAKSTCLLLSVLHRLGFFDQAKTRQQGREHLAGFIVQFAGQPLPLTLAGENLVLEKLPLRLLHDGQFLELFSLADIHGYPGEQHFALAVGKRKFNGEPFYVATGLGELRRLA